MQQVCKRSDLDDILRDANPDTVLDIGCSTCALRQATHLLDYIDNSLIYPERNFIVHDINNDDSLPFGDKYFDFVYCSHVLEHVDRPEYLLSEINRVGKAGLVIVPTKLEDNLYSIDAVKDGDMYLTDRYGHKWWFDYGRDALLEICDRIRVVRRIPQSETEIGTLRKYMANTFELCIYWTGYLSWQFVPHPIVESPMLIRVGVSDLGNPLKSLISMVDAISDLKNSMSIKHLKRKNQIR